MAITRISRTPNVTSAADTLLYTVPAATSAQLNTFVCNGSSAATFRLAFVSATGTLDWSQHSVYNETTITKNTPAFAGGVCVEASGLVYGRSSTSSVSFVITGIEVT